ncbi:hypothetical protein E2562_011848 [Oryza meyeriana var. granulata]|uniref:RING-type E3 ubiquitin transferase n=1 Tax=Oryza meyeriana var. granulata TaxID=110450 RepID=A0A6G1CPC9_9ORYZ|nr:hypothetical protein E2562_011848 [Oryza meyeriana var. granulata]
MSSPPERVPPAPTFATTGTSGGGPSPLVVSNGVLLAAVIFLFMVVVFVFLLYLYAKRYLGANPLLAPSSPSSRFLFIDASPFPRRGLPASVLRALPVTVYAKPAAEAAGGGSGEALECAVCLSEVADGEKVRLLPKCDHGFHVECIDMWFHSHDTCPLCRGPVGSDAGELTAEGLPRVPREEPAAMEFPMFPTNILFWGTHDDVTNAGDHHPFHPPPPPFMAAPSTSSSASGRRKENLVIDIPTRSVAVDSVTSSSASTPLPASRMPDDMRSPVSARLRSLRQLLSRGKQAVVGPSFSPRGGDIEQGLVGADAARPPKTPKTPPAAN